MHFFYEKATVLYLVLKEMMSRFLLLIVFFFFFFATVLEDLLFFQLTGKLCKIPFLGSSRAGVSKL